jgi:hypothetical protein
MATVELKQWGAVFSVQSMLKGYKQDKFRVSQLWDIRQLIRAYAEDIVTIHYQETASQNKLRDLVRTVMNCSVCELAIAL